MFKRLKSLYLKYKVYMKYRSLVRSYKDIFDIELSLGIITNKTVYRLVLNILACSRRNKNYFLCKYKAEAKILPDIVLNNM